MTKLATEERVAHTPGKWTAHGNRIWSSACKDRGAVCVFDLATGTHIPYHQNETNAEFVANACNAHEELVSALRHTVKVLELWVVDARSLDSVLSACRAALSQAGAK